MLGYFEYSLKSTIATYTSDKIWPNCIFDTLFFCVFFKLGIFVVIQRKSSSIRQSYGGTMRGSRFFLEGAKDYPCCLSLLYCVNSRNLNFAVVEGRGVPNPCLQILDWYMYTSDCYCSTYKFWNALAFGLPHKSAKLEKSKTCLSNM